MAIGHQRVTDDGGLLHVHEGMIWIWEEDLEILPGITSLEREVRVLGIDGSGEQK